MHNGNYEADLDDDYNDYLDKKACRDNIEMWTEYKSA